VAWRRRADLPSPPLRRAWLFGVARTLLKADGRVRQRDRDVVRELVVRPSGSAEAEGSARSVSVVAAALARLAPHDRELLQLVAWEGLTPAELAAALGVRPGTARVRLHRARRALASDPAVRALVEEPAAGGAQTPVVEEAR
jgi:RNA polymerase sigma factor (sigma-70 family)